MQVQGRGGSNPFSRLEVKRLAPSLVAIALFIGWGVKFTSAQLILTCRRVDCTSAEVSCRRVDCTSAKVSWEACVTSDPSSKNLHTRTRTGGEKKKEETGQEMT